MPEVLATSLPNAAPVTIADEMFVRDAGANKRVPLSDVLAYFGPSPWVALPGTQSIGSTSRLNANDTSLLMEGMALRYVLNGTNRYGIVKAVVANQYVDIQGYTLSGTLGAVSHGPPSMVCDWRIVLSGVFALGTTVTIGTSQDRILRWLRPRAQVVRASVRSGNWSNGYVVPWGWIGPTLHFFTPYLKVLEINSYVNWVSSPDVLTFPMFEFDSALDLRASAFGLGDMTLDLLLVLE